MKRFHFMQHSIHLLLLFLLSNCVISSPTQSPGPIINHVPDELTLLAFKSAINGDPFGRLGQWNRSLHFCRWPGVTCGGRRHPDRVRALDLSSLDLTGAIPPCLSNLTFLRSLSLNENQFYGPIPWELGHLSQLQHLNLSFNSLGGDIPATLSHCSRLQTLSFENNNLQGEVPSNLSRCSKLQYIHLGNNMLVGEIPRQLGTLPILINLYLHTNTLSGGIPPSLGNLSSLRHLDLSANSLSGGIPPSFGKLSSILYLNLGHNNLLGVIPLSIYNISGIHTIVLADNNLHGTIPNDIGYKFPRLRSLVMYENKLHGPLPVSLANASQLEDILLHYNRFSGTISEKLAALQSLSILDLASNQLEAREPEDWSFLAIITNSSLQGLDMGFNSLGEYGMANKVSTQGDVYSYGIILLEMFTGKRPIDDIFKEGLCLRQYVGASFSEKLVDVIDPCLFTHEEVGDADGNITNRKSIDCIASVLRIGLLCTNDSPSDRINMGDVTKNVQLVIDTFFRI